MAISRREFLRLLAAGSAAGLPLESGAQQSLYEMPKFGNVRLLHFTEEEVAVMKSMREQRWQPAYTPHHHLSGLGFVQIAQGMATLQEEGENLCRHLWGIEPG